MKRLVVLVVVLSVLLLPAHGVLAAIPDPGAANTNIVLFNPNTQDTNLRLSFLNADQTGVAWTSDGGGPMAANALRIVPYSEFGGQAAGNWQGCADIASDRPLLALAVQFWDNTTTQQRWAAAYPALLEGATEAFLPNLTKVDGRLSRITLQNCEDAQATAYIHFYSRKGVQSGVKTLTLQPLSETTLRLDQVAEANFSTTSNYGTGWITATRRVAVTSDIFYTDRGESYSAPTGGDTTIYVPGKLRVDNGDGTWETSVVNVQNLGTTTATVQVQYIKLDGTVTYSYNDSIAAKGAAAYNTTNQGTLSTETYNALIAALGTNWRGTVKIACSNGQPLAGVCYYRVPSTGILDEAAFNATPASQATSSALVFPLVYRRIIDSSNRIYSTAMVANTTSTAGTVTVQFYNPDGSQRGSNYTVNIAARGMVRLNLYQGVELPSQALTDLGTAFTGSMVVRPSSGLAIVGVNYLYWNDPSVLAYDKRLAAYAGLTAP
jgi:hypothetical protein